MSDVFTIEKRSDIMSRVRSRGNRLTELTLARLLREHHIFGWRRGVIVRLSYAGKRMGIKPDFVFVKQKVVVFVDGEFWHGHPTRATIPRSHHAFWLKKIERNKARDRLQNRLFRKLGWKVVRIWQRDIKSLRWIQMLVKTLSAPSLD